MSRDRLKADLPILAALMAAFLATQFPSLFREAPGLDEDLYAVPGLMVARTGVPTIPYLPTRDPATFYQGADIALYTLPPLSFYAQAPFYLVLPPGIGPARLASVAAGLLAVGVVYGLGVIWGLSSRGALLGSAAYLFSRPFFFPAVMARPDMLTAAMGLLAMACLARPESPRPIASGFFAGLSMLSHPYGIVVGAQGAGRLLFLPGTVWGRAGRLIRFGLAALAGLALWIPLIALHPDLFRRQFGGNVMGRAGTGLGATLLNPLPALAFQFHQLLDRAGAPALVLAIVAGLFLLFQARRPGPIRELAYHVIASLVLLILFMGHHPMLGYFAYPAAFAAIAIGLMLDAIASRIGGRVGTVVVASVLMGVLIPGGGLKRTLANYRHWGDPAYDPRVLARQIEADLPTERVVAVDAPMVLAFYLDGRPVIHALYVDFLDVPYEYVVMGRRGFDRAPFGPDDVEFVRSYGDEGDPFAPYAEVWRRKDAVSRLGGPVPE
ncbi:MAG: glycosyltransferase family 39 protein [Isosphaeraceae bacterium]